MIRAFLKKRVLLTILAGTIAGTIAAPVVVGVGLGQYDAYRDGVFHACMDKSMEEIQAGTHARSCDLGWTSRKLPRWLSF